MPVRPVPLLTAAAALALAGALGSRTARAARGLPRALGARPAALKAAAARSPHARDGRFANVEPGFPLSPRAVAAAMLARGDTGLPAGPVPLAPQEPPAQAGALAVTWYGHSSVLVEVDGRRVLADPVWGDRVSPSPTIGPRRMHPVPVPLSAVPAVDAVLLSHDHYDHLDAPTIVTIAEISAAPFVVPLGIGAHLRHWGVPEERIVELDWGQSHTVGDLRLTCCRARHFSGRGLVRNTTQWASWAIEGPRHRAFFGGDTGYSSAFGEIRAAMGPFDLTLLPIGAYADLWPDVHMTPEEAVRAAVDLGPPALFVPIHWATFNLGFHSWAEPVHRLVSAAVEHGVPVAVPQPGARVDATAPTPADDWWSALDRRH